MQVVAINNNEPGFGHIYVLKNPKMTQEQAVLISDIVNALRQPLPKFRNKTAEVYYKKKKGYDFHIKACANKPDSVFLEGFKGLKFKTRGKEEIVTYDDNVMIGIYNKDKPFKTDDVKSAIDAVTEIAMPYLMPLFAGTLAVLTVLGMYISDKPKQVIKPLTETIDTVSNKTKAILPDTTKILKPIKK